MYALIMTMSIGNEESRLEDKKSAMKIKEFLLSKKWVIAMEQTLWRCAGLAAS